MLKQRVGSTITIPAAPYTFTAVPGGTPFSFSIGPETYLQSKESIQTVNGDFKQTNACVHEKFYQSFSSPIQAYSIDNGTHSTTSWYAMAVPTLLYFCSGNGAGCDATVESYFRQTYPGLDPLNTPWRNEFSRSLQAMWPGIAKKFDESAANTAYEFPQTIALALTTGQRVRKLASLLKQSGKLNLALMTALGSTKFLENKSSWIKQILGSAARADLTWEFGLRPLIQDIVTVHNSLTQVRKEVSRLVNNQNKVLRSHWSTVLLQQQPTDRSRQTPVGNPNPATAELITRVLSVNVLSARYTASMKYSYELSGYSKEHLTKLAFLDTYGIGGFDPQILWNALPFSFIVDYFAHVGNFLHQSAWKAVRPSVNILDVSHSYKLEYERNMDLTVLARYGTGGTVSAHYKKYSYYIRERPVLDQAQQIYLRGFTRNNIRLLGTLLAALKLKG